MNILVIDDQDRNVASAFRLQNHGHSVTCYSDIELAYNELRDHHAMYDAVLTDLHMPVGLYRGSMGRGYFAPEGEIPAGLVFAIKAANCGIRTIICTDSDHHRDWMCALLDLLGRPETPDPHQRIVFVEARCCRLGAYYDEKAHALIECEPEQREGRPLVKDWHAAMKGSRLFPELFPKA